MIAIANQSLAGLTFIDLFAGIGGFRLALESLGANCVYSNEWNLAAQETYKLNFGETPEGDITKVDEHYVPDHDILCAGFPCQAFSISGLRRGFEDARGTLFFDVARIVREKKPKVVFMENVKNFATHDGGKTLAVVKATMEELGYYFNSQVLNPVKYGIPQQRERIYMVCFRKDLGIEDFHYPKGFPLKRHVEDFLLSDEETIHQRRERDDFVWTYSVPIDQVPKLPRCIQVGRVNKGGQGERIYSPTGCACTFSAFGGGVFSKTGGYIINGHLRRLHPREAARIMGFPDNYILNPSAKEAYQQIGNSVVVDVLQYVAIEIGETLLRAHHL